MAWMLIPSNIIYERRSFGPLLPPVNGVAKVMFSLCLSVHRGSSPSLPQLFKVSGPPPCTGPFPLEHAQTCSTWTSLYMDHSPPNVQNVHYVARTVGKLVVGIALKCLLVSVLPKKIANKLFISLKLLYC